jgi:hypothetical protein
MRYIFYIITIFLSISSSFSKDEDISLVSIENSWDSIVSQHVYYGRKESINTTLVNYDILKADEKFHKLISNLKNFDITKLHNKEEKLSFWINSYNIAAIKIITENYGVTSIKDLGSFFFPVWEKEAILLGGKPYSLNEIEHQILRKLDDPRIHFAIVCASLSCPDLNPSAYKANNIYDQLELSSKAFIQNNSKGLVFSKNLKIINVSKILKWFEEDFNRIGGVKSFISKHINQDISGFELKYLDYNWGLNEK